MGVHPSHPPPAQEREQGWGLGGGLQCEAEMKEGRTEKYQAIKDFKIDLL